VLQQLGKVLQVDPIKPSLKTPGTKRLKPKCDKPHSNLLSNSTCAAIAGHHQRRQGPLRVLPRPSGELRRVAVSRGAIRRRREHAVRAHRGRAVQVDPMKPKLTPTGIKLLKLKYDEPLSKIAFQLYLRRYTVELPSPPGSATQPWVGGWSRENKTPRRKPLTLKYFYSLLTGKLWGHFTGPCSDLLGLADIARNVIDTRFKHSFLEVPGMHD